MTKGKAPLVRPWTEEEDARLLRMVGQKRHRALIAASLKRTIKGVAGRLRVLRRDGKGHDDAARTLRPVRVGEVVGKS